MTYIYVFLPIIAVILIFIAYSNGKKSGEKKEKLRQAIEEIAKREKADEIIKNNANLTDNEFGEWLRQRNKK